MNEMTYTTDDEIMKSGLPMAERRYLLARNHGCTLKEMMEQIRCKNEKLLYHGRCIYRLDSDKAFTLEFAELTGDTLMLEGKTNLSYFYELYQVVAYDTVNHKMIPASIQEYQLYGRYAEDGTQIYYSYECHLELPLSDGASYVLQLFDTVNKTRMELNYRIDGYYSKFNQDMEHGYVAKRPWIVTYQNGLFQAETYSIKGHKAHEEAFAAELLEKGLADEALIELRQRVMKENIRKWYWTKKEKWLISDRAYRAGDNGEALFRYAARRRRAAKVRFLLDQNSPDYPRLRKAGKVTPYGTEEHKLQFLTCDKLISASADGWVFNLMMEQEQAVKDLYLFRYAFLAHGILMKDMSKWLHKSKKHIRMVNAATQMEQDAMVNGNFGYSDKEVKLVGFARFDALENHPEKIVTVMPTWRKGLAASHVASEINEKIFVRGYSETFKDSEYYRFYQGLISSPELIAVMKKHGYKLRFYLHPSFEAQERDFLSVDESVEIMKLGETVYKDVFAETSLMVTDYSSIAFDYAYLKKPLIYCQFDQDFYFNHHTGERGYFVFEEMGFGPVCCDLETTVQKMIEVIEGGCRMEECYQKRVEECFAFTDRNNCKRIYDAILQC